MKSFLTAIGKHLLPLFLALLIVAGWGEIASACPTCKENMADDPDSANLVRGYFWSIIFMMSMPFIIFTSLCSYFYYEVCKARAQQAQLAAVSLTSE